MKEWIEYEAKVKKRKVVIVSDGSYYPKMKLGAVVWAIGIKNELY